MPFTSIPLVEFTLDYAGAEACPPAPVNPPFKQRLPSAHRNGLIKRVFAY